MMSQSICLLATGRLTGVATARMTALGRQRGFCFGMFHMDLETTNPQPPEHSVQAKHIEPRYHPASHHVKPIDRGYRLVVRIVLWVISAPWSWGCAPGGC